MIRYAPYPINPFRDIDRLKKLRRERLGGRRT